MMMRREGERDGDANEPMNNNIDIDVRSMLMSSASSLSPSISSMNLASNQSDW